MPGDPLSNVFPKSDFPRIPSAVQPPHQDLNDNRCTRCKQFDSFCEENRPCEACIAAGEGRACFAETQNQPFTEAEPEGERHFYEDSLAFGSSPPSSTGYDPSIAIDPLLLGNMQMENAFRSLSRSIAAGAQPFAPPPSVPGQQAAHTTNYHLAPDVPPYTSPYAGPSGSMNLPRPAPTPSAECFAAIKASGLTQHTIPPASSGGGLGEGPKRKSPDADDEGDADVSRPK